MPAAGWRQTSGRLHLKWAVSNADLILQAIEHSDGLTDAELVRRTGIRPHQQVNQICRRLAAQGRILREIGRDG